MLWYCVHEVRSICRQRLISSFLLILLETDYQERLELKSASDRTLGVGVVQMDSVVLVLTAATMMKVNVDIDQVLKFNPE